MNGTPVALATPQHEPSRVWTIAIPAAHAQRVGVSLVHVTATQMGEVIVTLVDTAGSVAMMAYALDEPIKLGECKAVCDKFNPQLWPMVLEWQTRWARAPWSYIGANKPRSALRERYLRGTDPGVLMRPAPGDVAREDVPEPPAPTPDPDFWSDVGGVRVANFDRARRDDVALFRAAHPDVEVVAWSCYGEADKATFERAKARAGGGRVTQVTGADVRRLVLKRGLLPAIEAVPESLRHVIAELHEAKRRVAEATETLDRLTADSAGE